MATFKHQQKNERRAILRQWYAERVNEKKPDHQITYRPYYDFYVDYFSFVKKNYPREYREFHLLMSEREFTIQMAVQHGQRASTVKVYKNIYLQTTM